MAGGSATPKVETLEKKAKRLEFETQIGNKICDICELALLTGRTVEFLRGSSGYCTTEVSPDFQARLAQRGVWDEAGQLFRDISQALQFRFSDKTYMIGLADRSISFHAIANVDAIETGDLISITNGPAEARIALVALESFYNYLQLPDALAEARQSKPVRPMQYRASPAPTREPRQYDINPERKMEHICEYIEDGDYRTFFDMFDGDDGREIILWVDHREDDEDIPKLCEHILKTGSLDGRWGGDEMMDLVISFRGVDHRISYPNPFADRDTSIIALNDILSPDFELRYCTASNGSDGAAFLPLTREQWNELDERFEDRLAPLFLPVGADFAIFGLPYP
jgi:hypothetical protein